MVIFKIANKVKLTVEMDLVKHILRVASFLTWLDTLTRVLILHLTTYLTIKIDFYSTKQNIHFISIGHSHLTYKWKYLTMKHLATNDWGWRAVNILFNFLHRALTNLIWLKNQKTGNAPVAPLVLHGVVGGGDHLPSGDSYARLPCLFP